MQALPITPVDLPAATPSANPAPATAQDGLFASRLQAATRQQQTSTVPNATGQADSVSGSKQKVVGPDTDQRDTKVMEEPPATSLNGSAGAALQAVAADAQTTNVPVPPNAAPGGETAIARMLDVLSKGGGSTLETAAAPVNGAVMAIPAAESVESAKAVFIPAVETVVPVTPQIKIPPGDTPVQAVAGGITPLALASSDNDLQPPISTAHAGSTPLPGSASLVTGQAGPPQIEVTITESTQTPDRAQPSIQASVTISEQAEASAASSAVQAGNPLYVQNKYGQVIAIQQGCSTTEEGETDSPATAVATGSGQRLDANSNSIRSNLPKDMPDRGAEQNSGQPAVSTPRPQQGVAAAGDSAQPGQTFAEQTVLQNNQPTTSPDSQPLIFAQPVTSSLSSTATTPGQSTVYHLASGLMVPEGTVVDQMIAHFAINKRFDTGEVTLRLHPQELGEIRMAIKVEQDNVKAHIIAQNPQAQEMIDRHLPRLREALEQQGLNLHQIEVTVAAHDNAGGERFQDNNAWRQPTASAHRLQTEQPVFTLEPDAIMAADTAAANTTLSVLA